MLNRKLKIGIVVGEVSGDTLGAKLIRRFREQGIDAEFEGIGGPQMIAEGFKSYYPMDILSVMGIVEVLKDIKKLFAVRDGLVETWNKDPVDIFIGIDAPDFNLRLSKTIKQKQLPIKTVQYVSPSVWAWRQGRIHGIKASIDLVLCLFPFEKAFFKKWDVPAAFVGHPLASQLPLENPILEAQTELGLDPDQKYIALLPGSRRGEIERLGPLVLDAANILHHKYPDYTFLIPAINDARKQQIESLLATYPESLKAQIRLMENTSAESKIGRQVMNASNIIALASGTATLEAMLCRCPMVVAYRMSGLTFRLISRMLRTDYVSLPNLLANELLVPEILQDRVTAGELGPLLLRALDDRAYREYLLNSFDTQAERLRLNADQRAADAVDALLQARARV